jgi:rSAM/selenodomain-associated transferase 1
VREAIVVMAKAPRVGAVKTRLYPALGPDRATELYACFLRDTLAVAERARGLRPSVDVVLCYAPADDLAGFDGLVSEGVAAIPQRGADLGERLTNAVRDVAGLGFGSAVVVGADSPTLPVERLVDAFVALERGADVVLGPTADGGYYLVGVRGARDDVFRDVDWSTSAVFAQTLERAATARLRTVLLDEWFDVDEPADLERLRLDCGAASHTRAFLNGGRFGPTSRENPHGAGAQ